MKKIGLVGGISWVSTIDYYRYINEGVNQKLGGLNFVECLIYSLNFGDVQAVTWPNSFELLLGACQSLKNGGAEAIALCCNTGHMDVERLESECGLPILHIVSATADEIHKRGLKKVALLGTKFTMEMDFYKDKLIAKGLEPIIPEKEEVRDLIQHTIKNELGAGIVKEETKKAYLEIIDHLIDKGAEGVILGCTEIPLIIQQSDVSIPVFDTTKIHSAAIVDYILA